MLPFDLALLISFYLPYPIAQLLIKTKNTSDQQYLLTQASYFLNLDKQSIIAKVDQVTIVNITNLLATYNILLNNSQIYISNLIYPHLLAKYGNTDQIFQFLQHENIYYRFNEWGIFNLCQRGFGQLLWLDRKRDKWKRNELIVLIEFGNIDISFEKYASILGINANPITYNSRLYYKSNMNIGDLEFILMLVLAHPTEDIFNKFKIGPSPPNAIQSILQYYHYRLDQPVVANMDESIIVGLQLKSLVADALQRGNINTYQFLRQIQYTGNYDMLITLFSIKVDNVLLTIRKDNQLDYLFTEFIFYYLFNLIDNRYNNGRYWVFKTGWQLTFNGF